MFSKLANIKEPLPFVKRRGHRGTLVPLPYYEVSTNEEKEEKKFISPLEKPKRVIKDKTNRINFYS
jgi:hypothetical protein